MARLLQINPVLRTSTSTGRIVQEIGDVAIMHGWESYIAYSFGRDGVMPCTSDTMPVGNRLDVALHGLRTRTADTHGLASEAPTRQLVESIRQLSPDVIHLHNIHGYFLNYKILFDYLSQCDIPVVWTVHDCWLYTGHCYYYSAVRCNRWQTQCHDCPQRRQFPASWLRDRSARNFEDKRRAFTSMPANRLTMVPVSAWLREEMSHSFMRDYPFKVIPNGIDTQIFKPEDPTSVRRKYDLGDRHVYLAVASIWSREKGLDDLIRLAPLLHNDEVLVMVGVDRKLAATLPSPIVSVERTQHAAELAALYSAATCLLNPTWQDNYPTVNLEAIASGTPVVTYQTGGSVEAITPETGCVVPQGNLAAMLSAARHIAAAGHATWMPACRAHALAHFRKQDRYEAYIKLYEDITNR